MPTYPNALAQANPQRNLLAAQMLQASGEGSYLRQQFPQVYGFLGGLAGTAPDEMQGSALDPNTAAVKQGASYGYLPGLVASSAPLGKAGAGLGMLAGMARGTGKAEEALAAIKGAQKFDNTALTGAKFVAPQEKTLSNLSYRGSHTAPGPDFGAPLHDLTGGGQMYPADVYSAKAAQYYGTGYPKADKEAFALAQRVRGNPNAEVTMYRAVPKDESITSINPGDWVTLSKDYAKTHGESVLENNYNILSQKVKAKDLWTNADSIHEFGYQPQNTTSTSVQFDNSALMK